MEPLDFETFLIKNKTVLQNDPQRELLLYPSDDISVSNNFCSIINHFNLIKVSFFNWVYLLPYKIKINEYNTKFVFIIVLFLLL